MSTAGSRRGHRSLLGLGAVAVLALSGCMLPGTDRTREPEPEWVEDAQTGRFYRPDDLQQSFELPEEHLPQLKGYAIAGVIDGRFTDPTERAPLPAPDDHWWQAVMVLRPEQTAQLVEQTGPKASDGGGYTGSETATGEDEMRELLVQPLEDLLEGCAGQWVSVAGVLSAEEGYTRTAAGDNLEMALLCDSSGMLVTSAHDM